MKKNRWLWATIFIVLAWMGLMVGASYLGYENKLPVRIENWKPEPSK